MEQENPQTQKCADCTHFVPDPAKPGFGFCFGVLISREQNPNDSEKCGGKYFSPKYFR